MSQLRSLLFPLGLLFLLLPISCTRSPAAIPAATLPLPVATPTPPPPLPLPTATPSPTLPVVTLTIWHSWNEDESIALAQILLGFQQKYPHIILDVLHLPSEDLLTRYQNEHLAGGGPTLLLGPAEWGPTLHAAGMVEDLQSLITTENLSALNQAALRAAYQGQTLIGLPYAVQGVVLYRNKDILTLNAASFDEMVTLAQTAAHGEVLGAVLERSFFYSGGHLLGMGGQLMKEDGRPGFNDEKGLAWVQLLMRFAEVGPTVYFSDEDLERFKKGQVGWIVEGTWNLRNLASAIGPENLAIDPWPRYEVGRMAGFVTSENLYLSSGIEPEIRPAAQALLNYFISPEAQTLVTESGRLPAIGGVALTNPVLGPLIMQSITALANGVPYLPSDLMTIYALNLDIALRAIFEGQSPPEQALSNAAQEIERILASTPTPNPNP